MGVFNELGKSLQVETRRLDYVAVIDGIPYQARKAVPQNVEVACGPLNVSERGRIDSFQKVEPRATHDHIIEVPEQFLVMLLADAVEVHEFAIEVVQHLDFGRILTKKYLCAARECFHIRRMLRKYFNDPLCQTVLPTYVRKRSSHFLGSTKSLPG
jgi:hypothetical protein